MMHPQGVGSLIRPEADPVSNDIKRLATNDLVCLGHIWWPLWWLCVRPICDTPDPLRSLLKGQ